MKTTTQRIRDLNKLLRIESKWSTQMSNVAFTVTRENHKLKKDRRIAHLAGGAFILMALIEGVVGTKLILELRARSQYLLESREAWIGIATANTADAQAWKKREHRWRSRAKEDEQLLKFCRVAKVKP